MTDEKYNGWTNRDTWCVWLRLTDAETIQRSSQALAQHYLSNAPEYNEAHAEFSLAQSAVFPLADHLEALVSSGIDDILDRIAESSGWHKGILVDLFTLSRVDWNEIARALIADIEEESD